MYRDPNLLHTDKVLSDISVAYRNLELVGDVLFPMVRVDKQSDKYNVLEKTAFDTFTDDQRAPGSKAAELPPMTLSRDSFFCEEHALQGKVPVEEEELNDSPDIDPIVDETERTTDSILLGREIAIQTLVTTTANYATGHSTTLSGTAQWSDYANSQPISDLKTARDKVFSAIQAMPSVVLMGYEVASKLEDHPKFLDRVKSGIAETTDQFLMRLTGLGRLIRGTAVKNTAAIGAARTLGYVWGKDVVVAFVPARPGRKVPAFGYEFVWPFGGRNGRPNIVDRWYDQDTVSTKVRTRRRYDLKFAAVDDVSTGKAVGGYVIKAAIA